MVNRLRNRNNVILETYCSIYFFVLLHPKSNLDRSFEVSKPHTLARSRRRYDSSERVVSPSQRPLPDNTQHSQERDIHVPGGIRTRNCSKLSAADPRLIPLGHWERLMNFITFLIQSKGLMI